MSQLVRLWVGLALLAALSTAMSSGIGLIHRAAHAAVAAPGGTDEPFRPDKLAEEWQDGAKIDMAGKETQTGHADGKLGHGAVTAAAEDGDLPENGGELLRNAGDKPGTHKWLEMMVPVAMRSEPGRSKPAYLIPTAGMRYPVLDAGKEWARVKLTETQDAWVPLAAARVVRLASGAEDLRAGLPAGTPLLGGPGPGFPATGKLARREEAVPLQVNGGYVKVTLADSGRTVWVNEGDIADWAPSASGNAPAKPAVKVEVLEVRDKPLFGTTIVLDAGHGGKDKGAIGDAIPVYEKDINLAVAKVLSTKLEAAGAHVILTRKTDDFISLQDRVDVSNEARADAFVSIHQNVYVGNPNVSGTITYYDQDDAQPLAAAIEDAVNRKLHGGDAGKRDVERNNYYVLRNNERPAVLVEGCFLTNPDELKNSMLPDYQEKAAEGMYEGLLAYFDRK